MFLHWEDKDYDDKDDDDKEHLHLYPRFAKCLQYSRLKYGTENGVDNLLQVGISTCELTEKLLNLFGEQNVKIQIELFNLRHGDTVYESYKCSPGIFFEVYVGDGHCCKL